MATVADLSVITPVYNGARYLRECVESVLAQEVPVEHVFADGGSTDGTIGILEEYASRHPGRVIVASAPDRGACDGWNKGIALARGDILGWLGADDVMTPGAARIVAEFLEANREAAFVYGEADIIDEQGAVVGRYATSDFEARRAIEEGNGIPAMAAWFRRALYDEVGPFDASIHLCDCDWFLRAGLRHRLHRIPETLAQFRMHGVNVTGRLQRTVYPREDFLISRRHGGGFLTPIALRFYRSLARRVPVVGGLLERREAAERIRATESARIFRTVAVFGAALSGQRCARMLRERGVEIACFLDNAPPPGRRFLERPAMRPEEWAGEERAVDAVYVASAGRHAEMRASLKKAGWKGPVVDFR